MKAKRVLAVALAASMVFGSVGCMKKNEANKPGSKKEKREAVAVPEDIWEPYEEEVVINMAVPENSTYVFKDGDDYDNNPWYREYKERFNIQVKNKWVSADYSTKLNLAIAEGDLPDVFAVNAKRLKELQEADLIWDLTEVFEKNAGDNLKGYREKYADVYDTGYIDGKMYGIAQLNMGPEDYMEEFWVRKDIKEGAGFAEGTKIQTIEDLDKVANYAKEQGMYAFTDYSDMPGLYALATAYDTYATIWTEDAEGKLAYGATQPGMKKAVAKYREWYENGLLNPDFTTDDYDKMGERLINKEAAMALTGITWCVGTPMVEKFEPEEYFECYSVPTENGELAKSGLPFQNWGYIVVSKDCPNPDAVIRCLNFYTYYMDDAGENPEEDRELLQYLGQLRNMPASMRVYNPETERRRTQRICDALYTTGSATDTSTWGCDANSFDKCVKVVEERNAADGGEFLVYGGLTSSRGSKLELVEQDCLVKSAVWGAPTEQMSQLGSTLDSLLLEGFTKIVVGEQPVDYFDTLIEEWKAAGGEKLTEEVNEVYGK